MSLTAGKGKMIDSFRGLNRKRKSRPRGRSESNTYGVVSLASCSWDANESCTSNLPPRPIGDDGNYYECVICNYGGDLLCCDFCPCTYHFQCLNPPLECVPPGSWKCPNCCKEADHGTQFPCIKSSKENISSNNVEQAFSHNSVSSDIKKKLDLSSDLPAPTESGSLARENLPAVSLQSLYDLAEAGDLMESTSRKYDPTKELLNALDHDGDEKGTETSTKSNEIRGADIDANKSTLVCDSFEMVKGDRADKPVINTSRLLAGSSIQFQSGEQADRLSGSENLQTPTSSPLFSLFSPFIYRLPAAATTAATGRCFPLTKKMDPNDDVFFSIHYPSLQTNNDDASSSPPPFRSPKIFDRYFANSSSSSSDDDDDIQPSNSNPSLEASNKRLDYMIQFLDRKLFNNNSNNTPNNSESVSHRRKTSALPELIGKGGGTGIFRVPVRAAVHPDRPPSLEIRPHPLRESQVGRFLRTIVTTETQLWGGRENGAVHVWEFKEMYGGSDETAPFKESVVLNSDSGVTCLVGDEGSRVVWSGHRDGRIRCWKMDTGTGSDRSRVKEVLSWVAHRGPVMSMIMSCYGDLWSGSEGGVIKIWPWEELEKAFSFTAKERHMAALSVERSYIDLRNQVTVNGFGNVLNSDVRYMLSDNSRAKVWTAGYLSFALWDARTRELLKSFNLDGQIERPDMLSGQDLTFEDEIKMKIVAGPKKEKTQTSFGFFQRSRNVIMGAADAVRRVAAKGGFGDDNRRTEALIITTDGMIWTGCANGSLVQWDGNGNRLQDFQYHPVAVQCLCAFGLRIWVGYASGIVQVLDLVGNLLGGWVAHSSPVIKMAVGAGYVFTLANHGGIRGWNVMSPGPLDGILRSELAGKEFLYTRIENLKILTGTWNVAQGRASQDSLVSWLGAAAGDVGIVVVGLQEVEMGAGVLAMSAAKETVGLEGSSVGQWWLDMIGKTLDEGSTFERAGSRQLAGLLIAMWVRNNLKAHVGDVDAAAVPCGFGHAIGNKGAVGLRIRVHDRVMCFVNCHFAAHLEAVKRRNADFDHVYRTMTFGRPSNFFNAAAAGTSSAVQMLRGANVMGANSPEGIPELSEADMVIFLGDFNYRLDGISYDEARDFVSQRSFDWLKEKDQLRAEMGAGNVFQGMREAVIRFPPTYKFEKHQLGLAGYDSGEKKRIPAWCDRVLYRDSRSADVSECCLDCPVVSLISQYDACMNVNDSDHKPVRCIFSVDIARVDESVRRQEFGDIMKSNEEIGYIIDELCKIPETIVSTNNIILQTQDTAILRITNKCGENNALFEVICEGQSIIEENGQASDHHPRGSFGFPRWLEVTPAAGIIKPEHIAEVSIHLEDFPTVEVFVDGITQNSWCEDTRDKEAMLVVKVRGTCNTNETRIHRTRVRHCCSSQTAGLDPRPNGSGQIQRNLLHRADYKFYSDSPQKLMTYKKSTLDQTG